MEMYKIYYELFDLFNELTSFSSDKYSIIQNKIFNTINEKYFNGLLSIELYSNHILINNNEYQLMNGINHLDYLYSLQQTKKKIENIHDI